MIYNIREKLLYTELSESMKRNEFLLFLSFKLQLTEYY